MAIDYHIERIYADHVGEEMNDDHVYKTGGSSRAISSCKIILSESEEVPNHRKHHSSLRQLPPKKLGPHNIPSRAESYLYPCK